MATRPLAPNGSAGPRPPMTAVVGGTRTALAGCAGCRRDAGARGSSSHRWRVSEVACVLSERRRLAGSLVRPDSQTKSSWPGLSRPHMNAELRVAMPGMATHRSAPNGSAGPRPPMTAVVGGTRTSLVGCAGCRRDAGAPGPSSHRRCVSERAGVLSERRRLAGSLVRPDSQTKSSWPGLSRPPKNAARRVAMPGMATRPLAPNGSAGPRPPMTAVVGGTRTSLVGCAGCRRDAGAPGEFTLARRVPGNEGRA
jgi:hypothetical protein